MGLHNPFDRDFYLIGGAVKKTGGSLALAKGQLGLINSRKGTADGAAVLANVNGISKDMKNLEFRMGVTDKGATRSHNNKSMSTLPFSLDEVKGLEVTVPQITEPTVDEIIVGYNGIDESTAFNFQAGDHFFRFTLELSGDAIAWRGAQGGLAGKETEIVSVNVEIPTCDPHDTCESCSPCTEVVNQRVIVEEIIERLKRKQLAGGLTVDKFVDITPVLSCDTPATVTEIPYDYYTLEVCDTGTDNALALVAQQYDVVVNRVDRTGANSKYQMLLPRTAGAPADYSQTIASIIKGCDECPAGYTASGVSGYLYAIDVEDNGVDLKADFQADVPGAVAGTSVRASGTKAGMGFYTIVVDNELTDAEIASLLAATPSVSGAPSSYESVTLENVGAVAEVCNNATVTTTSWVQSATCNVVEQEYRINLKDTSCGDDRLAELNSAYANTVSLAYSSTDQESTVTLTGTSGTADITIEGVVYTATFDTDLATSALNFDAAHSTALAALGIDVEVDGAAITFSGATTAFTTLPVIANTSDDLAGTVTALTAEPIKGGCQTGYSMQVLSNMVCEECDAVFEDYYRTDAPEAYEGVEWTRVVADNERPDGNCLAGVRIKGKTFTIAAEEALRDMLGFVETSTMIRAAADYPVEVREGIGRFADGTASVTRLSRWAPRTHLAGDLRNKEIEDMAYFRGIPRQDYLGRVLLGQTTHLEDQLKQYLHYTLKIRPDKNAQGFGGRISQDIDYGFWVEIGRHQELEDLLNNIASNAGQKTVQAFG